MNVEGGNIALNLINTTLDSGAVLTKTGNNPLNFGGTFTSGGGLSVKAGEVTTDANLEFETLAFHIDGTVPGTDYGQLIMADRDLSGAKLDAIPNTAATETGQTFVVITRTTGTLSSLSDLGGNPIAEDDMFTASDGSRWKLSYVGGDGNDVEIELLPPPAGTMIQIR